MPFRVWLAKFFSSSIETAHYLKKAYPATGWLSFFQVLSCFNILECLRVSFSLTLASHSWLNLQINFSDTLASHSWMSLQVNVVLTWPFILGLLAPVPALLERDPSDAAEATGRAKNRHDPQRSQASGCLLEVSWRSS